MSEPSSPIPGTRVEFIAVVTSMGLYGITCMQTYVVLPFLVTTRAKNALVSCTSSSMALNTTHQILTNRGFWVLISRVHDPFVLSREYLWAGLFTSLATFPTQLFFIMRIWRLSKKHWLVPSIFVPCSIFQLGESKQTEFRTVFLIVKRSLNGGPTAEIIYVIRKLPMAFWGVAAAEDVLISLTLIYLLFRGRGDTRFKSTDRLVYRLTVFAVNTGLWTSLCALFTIITMAAYPNIQTYVSLYLVICPLYCNTLLANLNARGYIRGRDFTEASTGHMSGQNRGMVFASFRSAAPQCGEATSHTEVHELSTPSFANNSSLNLKVSPSASLTGPQAAV
ncbi:hypothetical protein C8Q70DRAFT_917021 [Cubamyces menziesii]|nr:hypothetical protein C8Q70DRAFT_917021 [Cubamyces menziesii]